MTRGRRLNHREHREHRGRKGSDLESSGPLAPQSGERVGVRGLASVVCSLSFAVFLATTSDAHAQTAATAAGVPARTPQPSVILRLDDPSPVIGITGETLLHIEVTGAPDPPVPLPRVFCNAGQIEDLGREGSSTFTARYILPSGRFPQLAILVAEFASFSSPVRGMITIRLSAAATPTLLTDPGAQVTLHVDDRDFGPQTAPADGVVHVPVVVPPGVEFATARSVNQHGKATEQVIDLRVPYSQRLLFVTPEALAAGAVGEVAVYAVEASGRPANASTLVLRAQGTKVQPLGSLIPGEARFLVTAPTILKEKSLRLEAQIKDQSTTRLATHIPLVSAPATGLTFEPEASHLQRAPNASLRVFLGAEDAFGNPVDAGRAGVLVNGKPSEVTSNSDGEPMVIVAAPGQAGNRDVVVEGVLDNGHAIRRIPVGIHRGFHLRNRPVVPRAPRYTLTPRLGMLWNLGYETGATFFVDAVAYRSVRYPNIGVGLSLGLAQSWFSASSVGGIARTSLSTFPVLFELHRRFLVGPGFIALGAGAGFALAFAHIRSLGATVTGHGYGAALEADIESGFRLGRAHLVFALRYLAVYLGDLSSGDHIAGNAAGAVADVGYRLVW
jgi:hypothetical protein